MKLMNTEEEYGIVARSFHWLIAVLILGLLPMGLFMGGMENSPLKFEIYALHKSFGLLVFFAGVGRIAWRFVSPPPDELEAHAGWEVTLASAAHFWLYVCIIGMPLTGWLMSSAAEFPVPFFGFQLPWLIEKNEDYAHLLGQSHEILAYTLLFILGLHIAGALKHHVIDRDETLQRMTFKSAGLVLPGLVVIVAGLIYSACAYFIAQDFFKSKEKAPAAIAAPANAIPLPDTSGLPEDGWAIIPSESKLMFTTTMYETEFTGILQDFSGDIVFNPDDLTSASAKIRIGMDNVTTGDSDRDVNIIGPDWFDAAGYPDAKFETIKFEQAEGNNYVAIGNITIRGVTLPLSLPFTLDIAGDRAHMKGRAALNRLDFGMGKGEWEDPKSVGHEVVILIDLNVIR